MLPSAWLRGMLSNDRRPAMLSNNRRRAMRWALLAASLTISFPLAALGSSADTPAARGPQPRAADLEWPPGTQLLRFENVEGAVLLRAELRGLRRLGDTDTLSTDRRSESQAGRDTSGLVVLDTGAGYLALDGRLAVQLGIADSSALSGEPRLASGVLPRLRLGEFTLDQVAPVLTIDASVVRRALDRTVLGLLGHLPLNGRALWIDYRDSTLALVPALPPPKDHDPVEWSRRLLGGVLSPAAAPVVFRLLGDGKLVVQARVSDLIHTRYSEWLNLIVDTGATKSVLFEPALSNAFSSSRQWPALRGLSAPTLSGDADARVARIPTIEVLAVPTPSRQDGVDAALIQSPLAEALSRVTGMQIHGLLGYSFLRRYRIAIDYPDRVLWLDPVPVGRDERTNEYSTIGAQLERSDGAVRVAAVAAGSPAARVHVTPGDELLAVDGVSVSGQDLGVVSRRLEGPPGSALSITIRRGTTTRELKLFRRRLL